MMYFCPKRLYILGNSEDSGDMPPCACLLVSVMNRMIQNINPSVPSTSIYLHCSNAPINIHQMGWGNRDIRDACDLDN